MRRSIIVLLCIIFLQILNAQTVTEGDTTFVFIDTAELSNENISSPVEIDTSNKITMGKILLGASAVVGFPLITGLVGLSLFPPSFVVIEQGGNYNNGIAFEIALGWGDSVGFKFSKKRLIFQYSYLKNLRNRIALVISQDFLLKRVGRAGIFGIGFSIGIFGGTNFNSVNTAGVEFSAWFGNAMNIPYIFLFPQHHLFIKFRRGFEFGSGAGVNEIGIGFSSSITF